MAVDCPLFATFATSAGTFGMAKWLPEERWKIVDMDAAKAQRELTLLES